MQRTTRPVVPSSQNYNRGWLGEMVRHVSLVSTVLISEYTITFMNTMMYVFRHRISHVVRIMPQMKRCSSKEMVC